MTTSFPATLLLLTLKSSVNVFIQLRYCSCNHLSGLFFLRQRESSNPDSIQTDPLQIFLDAVENCKPVVGVISKEKGGRAFQVRSMLRSSYSMLNAFIHVYSQILLSDYADQMSKRLLILTGSKRCLLR